MNFTTSIKIRFGHVDPAGIVFYPRYFEFFNTVVEDWCEQALDTSFKRMQNECGYTLPTVQAECAYLKPSELDEILQAHLSLKKIGRSSLEIDIHLFGPDHTQRVKGKLVLVLMDMATRKSMALPEQLRQKMALYLQSETVVSP